jgi:phage terminase small subunit
MIDEIEPMKPLNKAQQVFVSEYLKSFNGTEAYSRAYPKSSKDAARANAARLIATDSIKAEITSRLAEHHMSADEALQRLADMARGDVTEFITPMGAFDIEAMKAAGKGHLIKKIKQKTVTKIGKTDKDEDTEVHDTEIEFYDAQAAIDKVLKVHGKYSDAPTLNINMSWKEFIESVNRSSSDK